MNSVQTQTLSIKGNGGGEAYIDFCDGNCVFLLLQKGNRRILTLSLLLYECLPMLISCIVKSVKNVKRRKENNYESVKR